jgi:hypothetical protein
MPDQNNEQRKGPFSWLRDILRSRTTRPPIISRERDVELETLRGQIDVIRQAFDETIGVSSTRDGGFQFLYHPERALMRTEDVAQVQRFFDDRQDVYRNSGDSLGEPVAGVTLYLMPARHEGGEVELLKDLDELDREIREGVATPDHILYVTPRGTACPATEPTPPPSANPVPAVNKQADAGKDVRVSVVDTGWYSPAAKDGDSPWLANGVEGDEEQLKVSGGVTQIHEYAGHGTFIAGIVKCIAPSAEVEIEGFLTKGGAIYESEITEQLNQAMTDFEDNRRTPEFDPRPPDLISISAGTRTRNDLGLLGFQVLSTLYKFDQDGGPLVVAAAGNDGIPAPFWPAAFDFVVGVGSLDADGRRSDFSNYGTWVDAWAQGSKLVNAFPTGVYKYVEKKSGKLFGTTQQFTGLAEWSGTSFATPVVTGAIAAHMSAKPGTTARQAANALMASASVKQDQKAGDMKAMGPPFS